LVLIGTGLLLLVTRLMPSRARPSAGRPGARQGSK